MVPIIKVIFVHNVISFKNSDYTYKDLFHKVTQRVGGHDKIIEIYFTYLFFNIKYNLVALYSLVLNVFSTPWEIRQQIQGNYVNTQIIVIYTSAYYSTWSSLHHNLQIKQIFLQFHQLILVFLNLKFVNMYCFISH